MPQSYPVVQICASLGADGLIYQEVEDLKAVAQSLNPNITQFDASCFTGEYITGEDNLCMRTLGLGMLTYVRHNRHADMCTRVCTARGCRGIWKACNARRRIARLRACNKPCLSESRFHRHCGPLILALYQDVRIFERKHTCRSPPSTHAMHAGDIDGG